jgi:hypothetical protein
MLFVNVARIALLEWRILRGSALPAVGTWMLSKLDRWALRWEERAVDRPWTPEASNRVDRIFAGKDGER